MKNDLFFYLKGLFNKSINPSDEQLKEDGYKNMIYMLNRFISMSGGDRIIDLVNYVNSMKYITERQHFDLFYKLLPKNNGFIKYMKGKKKGENDKLTDDIAENLKLGKKEVNIMINQLSKTDLSEIKKSFGGKGRINKSRKNDK